MNKVSKSSISVPKLLVECYSFMVPYDFKKVRGYGVKGKFARRFHGFHIKVAIFGLAWVNSLLLTYLLLDDPQLEKLKLQLCASFQ